MSGSGNPWDPNQPDVPVTSGIDPSLKVGLFGGGYANWLKNQPPPDLVALGAPADFSTDGTGLPPSVTMTGNLPMHTDPAASLQQVLSYTDNGSGAPPAVDASFIAGQEGGKRTMPYPVGSASQFPNAGITVATGVDLGAHTADDLKRWGVSDATIASLKPYFGLKGQAALDALNDRQSDPLPVIAQTDLDAMDQRVLNDTVGKVQQAYDATNPATSFSNLTPGEQTAIVDLAYQYGTNLASRTPKLWGDVTSGNWNAAVNELNNFGDAYAPRRRSEALRMQGLDISGK